jgi:serine/threonine protein kinase
VRLEVDSLLKAHDHAGEFLEQGTRSGVAVADAPAPPLLAKDTRLGAFQITAPLGAGGMGTVYRARDTRLDRSVAIKILTPRRGLADDQRQRLEREARAISRLSHPHICTLFDIAQARIPRWATSSFLVMELLDGEDACGTTRGRLALSGISSSVRNRDRRCAHLRTPEGIVHRDLKPQNIMMTSSGTKLLDFGLASFTLRHDIPDEGTPKPVASTAIMVGTVSYMAPEQILGHDVDARADLFSFGLVLHEMLSGRRAFDRPTHSRPSTRFCTTSQRRFPRQSPPD